MIFDMLNKRTDQTMLFYLPGRLDLKEQQFDTLFFSVS